MSSNGNARRIAIESKGLIFSPRFALVSTMSVCFPSPIPKHAGLHRSQTFLGDYFRRMKARLARDKPLRAFRSSQTEGESILTGSSRFVHASFMFFSYSITCFYSVQPLAFPPSQEQSQPDFGSMTHHVHEDSLSDEEALGNITQGCGECFALLFARHFRSVLAIAYRTLRSHSEAEEILQEVFLLIFLKQELYDPTRGSVRTWIHQFAYFKSMLRRRYLSVRGFYRQEELHDAKLDPARHSFECSSGLDENESLQVVQKALAVLPAQQRRAIELIHFEGYTLQETAAVSGESLANVRNLYYRGMKQLRDYLRRQQPVKRVPLALSAMRSSK
jgi:RNA polymerase sigma-70 factor, ECF subfamily